MTKQQKFLLILSPLLVVIMIFVSFFSTKFFGKTIGYSLTNFIYWFAFCIPSVIYITKGSKQLILQMYISSTSINQNYLPLYHLVSFIPVFATFVVIFIPIVNSEPASAIIIALLYAVINGTIEELYWRGLFNTVFQTCPFSFIAHILTNFFAFSGMIYDNWFLLY